MPEHPQPALRASDADRERIVTALSHHAGEGRLTVEELSERTDAAYAARTLGELDRLLDDLPEVATPASPVAEEEELRSGFREHLVTFLMVNVLLVGIWAATGAGYFWPIFPFLGWGVAVGIDWFTTREDTRRLRTASPEERARILAKAAQRRSSDPPLPHPPPLPPGPRR